MANAKLLLPVSTSTLICGRKVGTVMSGLHYKVVGEKWVQLCSVYEKYFEASDIVSDVYICSVRHSIHHIRHFDYYQLLFHTFSLDIMSDDFSFTLVMSGIHFMVLGEKWVWLCLVYTTWEWEKSGCGYDWFTLHGSGRKVGVVMSGLHYMVVGEKWVWLCLVYTTW